MTDLQVTHFGNITAQLGEMFEDYVIIAKPHRHGIIVHSSDATWALGAANRFKTLQDSNDRREDLR